jgi:hypothetical protein
MLAGLVSIGVIKTGEDAMSDLLYNQFIIRLAFFASPEHTLWVPLHIIHIRFGMIKLIIRKGDGKTGFNFLRLHRLNVYEWDGFNSYAVIIYDFTKNQVGLSTAMPDVGHFCSGLKQN